MTDWVAILISLVALGTSAFALRQSHGFRASERKLDAARLEQDTGALLKPLEGASDGAAMEWRSAFAARGLSSSSMASQKQAICDAFAQRRNELCERVAQIESSHHADLDAKIVSIRAIYVEVDNLRREIDAEAAAAKDNLATIRKEIGRPR